MKRNDTCEAVRVAGTDMYCPRCHVRWSVDDDAPQCKTGDADHTTNTTRSKAESARAFIRAFIRGDV